MSKNIIGNWGFLIAGILFLIAAIIPFVGGETVRVSFFVIGIALLLAGAAIARKRRADAPPKG
ncbi:MAG TPA: LPXTG cell wall anchor domain-containing protein [Chloroflexi bacterium]|nr:LPXTG cell wall anchor domain-containing protein [Chloroflexota bacterium]